VNLCRLQFLACLIGLVAGFAPCFSFTGSFWELGLSQFGDAPVRIDWVTPDSPAYIAGFRAGDSIHHAGGFDGVQQSLKELRPRGTHSFAFERDGEEITIEISGISPQLAAVWYSHPWYPLAGVIFLALGLLLFGTGPLAPPPFWRSVVVGVLGLALAAGFAFGLAVETVFTRWRIWQRWLMGNGDDWCFGQGYAGIAAGILLAVLAAVEARARLSGGGTKSGKLLPTEHSALSGETLEP